MAEATDSTRLDQPWMHGFDTMFDLVYFYGVERLPLREAQRSLGIFACYVTNEYGGTEWDEDNAVSFCSYSHEQVLSEHFGINLSDYEAADHIEERYIYPFMRGAGVAGSTLGLLSPQEEVHV